MRYRSVFIVLILLLSGAAAAGHTNADIPLRPVATYSIVARDSLTGQMGVAVQSHWFSVGPIVAWAEAGVGAIATQSFVDPSYGSLGLEMMKTGRTAGDALKGLLAADEGEAVRQVAMVDSKGNIAVHTGRKAIFAAGHQAGAQYSVQANLMDKPSVWGAMAEAYEKSEGDLAERLLAALEAAQKEGGDIRGKQSAAILIVSAENTGRPWVDRLFDLRVEDHPEPLKELRRVVTLQRAYLKLNEGDELVTKGEMQKALESYREATTIVSDKATNGEAAFWVGITLAGEGDREGALPWLARAYSQDARWARLVPRLVASGLLVDEDNLVDYLVEGMKKGAKK